MAVTIIAEIAQAHDGSLGRAHSFIDAVADAGADAIKFQTHIAEYESSSLEPWRIRFSYEDETRYDYWKRMEFTPDQWQGLIEHSHRKNLEFIGTPFCPEGLEMLSRLGVNRWKLASGEITNVFLLEKLASLGQPVIMSTGMSGWEEIQRTAEFFVAAGVDLSILQCTTAYPTPPEQVGLNVMEEMARRFAVPVGLSDHSGSIFPALAAVARGARIIEVHVCMSPYDFGPDTSSSLTVEMLKTLVDGVRYIERMLDHPVDKDAQARKLEPLHDIFTKSLYAREDLEAGCVLTHAVLGARKPCAGIPVTRLKDVQGICVNRSVRRGEFLRWEDINMDVDSE